MSRRAACHAVSRKAISARGWAYWLCLPPERRMVPKIKRFREWLLAVMEEAKQPTLDLEPALQDGLAFVGRFLGAWSVDPADQALALPDFAMHRFRKLPSGLERGGIVLRLDPFGSPDLSCPIEAVNSIRWHTSAPRRRLHLSLEFRRIQSDTATE